MMPPVTSMKKKDRRITGQAQGWWGGSALALAATGVQGATPASSGSGQVWLTKPIRFVCPYVAGGAGDIFTRTSGQKLSEAPGQAVIVDNRGGANGGIGTEFVARAPADGYTRLMGNAGPMTVNPVLYAAVRACSRYSKKALCGGPFLWLREGYSHRRSGRGRPARSSGFSRPLGSMP